MEPGPYAQRGSGKSAAARADANTMHKEVMRIYYLNKNVDAALKQEIITAVEDTYLSAKKTEVHGVSQSLRQETHEPPDGEVW